MKKYTYTANFIESLTTKQILLENGGKSVILDFKEIFDLLDKFNTEFLNNILNYSKEFNDFNYVDNRIWFSYLATSNIKIPPIEEQYRELKTFDKENIDISIQNNGRNINVLLKEEDFSKNYNQTHLYTSKKLFNSKTFNDKDNRIAKNLSMDKIGIIRIKTIYYNTRYEFLLAFLHCVFSSKRKYYLKKCEMCGHYFIANKSDTKYCTNSIFIDNKLVTCAERSTILKKRQVYININNKFKNKIQTIKKNNKYTDEYISNFKNDYKTEVKKYITSAKIEPLENFVDNYEKNHIITYY